MKVGNKKFILHASVRDGRSNSIQPAYSVPFFVVKYRLRIHQNFPLDYQWYKDVGGRDQCIDITVTIEDGAGERVTGKWIPLKVELYYEGGVLVQNQNILKFNDENKQYIDTSGSANIRLRIDEVCKNRTKLLSREYDMPYAAVCELNGVRFNER